MQKSSPRAGFIAMPSDSPSYHIVAVNYIHPYMRNRDSESAENFMAFGI
jgi:hypothetical protein